MHPLLNIAVNAAYQAGDIILRHSDQIDRIKITLKDNIEICSEVDLKAENAIIQIIQKSYPEHNIISEEAGSLKKKSDTTWIIDPLDGTNNFIHTFPFYAISIAILQRNKIEHGVILDPIRNECFTASRGQGARLNEKRIRVSKQTHFNAALLSTGFSTNKNLHLTKYLPQYENLIDKCAGVRRTGSTALDLAYIACGRLDGFWGLGLRSWDIAAGTLLVREAGGLISDPSGGELDINIGNIVTATPKIFKPLLQAVSQASVNM